MMVKPAESGGEEAPLAGREGMRADDDADAVDRAERQRLLAELKRVADEESGRRSGASVGAARRLAEARRVAMMAARRNSPARAAARPPPRGRRSRRRPEVPRAVVDGHRTAAAKPAKPAQSQRGSAERVPAPGRAVLRGDDVCAPTSWVRASPSRVNSLSIVNVHKNVTLLERRFHDCAPVARAGWIKSTGPRESRRARFAGSSARIRAQNRWPQ